MHDVVCGNKRKFHILLCLGVEFMACCGELIQEETLTSCVTVFTNAAAS